MIFSTSNFLSSTKLFLSAHLSNQDLRKLHASKHLLVDYRLFAQSSWLGDTYKNMFLAIIVPNAISSFTVRFYYQTMKNKCLKVQRLTGHLGVKHCFNAGRESGTKSRIVVKNKARQIKGKIGKEMD